MIFKKSQSKLTKNFFKSKTNVWMSHEDAVVKIPKKFKSVGSTKNSKLTIIENSKEKIYGVQFHPEMRIQIMEKKYLKTFYFLSAK